MKPLKTIGDLIRRQMSPSTEPEMFNIDLVSVGDNKVSVIRAVRNSTGMGLKETKMFVEKVQDSEESAFVFQGDKEEAEDFIDFCKEVGATAAYRRI